MIPSIKYDPFCFFFFYDGIKYGAWATRMVTLKNNRKLVGYKIKFYDQEIIERFGEVILLTVNQNAAFELSGPPAEQIFVDNLTKGLIREIIKIEYGDDLVPATSCFL